MSSTGHAISRHTCAGTARACADRPGAEERAGLPPGPPAPGRVRGQDTAELHFFFQQAQVVTAALDSLARPAAAGCPPPPLRTQARPLRKPPALTVACSALLFLVAWHGPHEDVQAPLLRVLGCQLY